MIKLTEVFFEWNRLKTEDKDEKSKKKASDDKVPSLAQLAKQSSEDEEEENGMFKGFPKFKEKPEEHPFGHPDFNDPQPKKSKIDVDGDDEEDETGADVKPDPQAIGKAADRITNKYYDNQKQKQKADPVKPSDKFVPSLAQLAQDAEEEEDGQSNQLPVPQAQDPALKGMPNFDHMAEPEEEPFGDPTVGQNDFRTAAQKGAAAAGQGLKKGAQAVGQGIKKGLAAFKKGGDAVPQSWEKDPQATPETSPEEDGEGMPSMASVAKAGQKEPAQANGLQGKHWKWKPGQKVDIGFIKGLTVMKVDQYGAQLQSKNGGIYRFVPHRGLRKISN